MPAILFGSISTVADTSELQRQAFNEAFEAHGLDWRWDREEYVSLLGKSGGQARIAEYGQSRGQVVDARAIHQTKSEIFQQHLTDSPVSPRPGVVESIRSAKGNGMKVGLVTTTSPENVAALLGALRPAIGPDDFDVIVDATSVNRPKPDKAAYLFALSRVDEFPSDCVAVEDNLEGAESAAAAGLVCIAFPNENTAQQEFPTAERRVDRLEFADLQELIQAA